MRDGTKNSNLGDAVVLTSRPQCEVKLGLPNVGNHALSLICPDCNGEYLHQENIEIFERGDGAKCGTRTATHNGSAVTVDGDITNNPSSERDGLLIHFFCEWCCQQPAVDDPAAYRGPTLAIYQDCGTTYFEWVRVKLRVDR